MNPRGGGARVRRTPGWACLALLLVGCSAEPPDTGDAGSAPTRGGTAVLGSITDVDNWNPYVARQTFAYDLLRRMYLQLAATGSDGREQPPTHEAALAESWSFSADRRVLTFSLREARWSDGRPITAADVVFTWQAQTSAEVAWTGAAAKQHVRSVEAADERTVVFRFSQVYPYQLADAVDGPILPQHVFGAVPFARWRTHDWSAVRCASGPFVLEDYRPEQEITLARNPRYYREDLPRLDRVVVRVVPDSGNLLSQLLAGEIDYLEGLSPRQAGSIAERAGIELRTFDNKYDFLGWNGARPPFDDRELRRALTLAIDREALVEDLLFGFGRVSRGPILSHWWAANRELEPWPADPARALAIFERKGYRRAEPDGPLARDGVPLEITMLTNAGNALREAMLVKIQEQLGRLGVRVEVQPKPMRTMREQVVSGDYDAYLGGWVFTGRVDLRLLFGSQGAMNIVSYRSAEVDALLDRLDEATDWREMKSTLDAIQVRIHEDQPYTFLYEQPRIAAIGPRLRGVEIPIPTDPLARLELFWVRGE